jgi:hypothetical protein
VQRVEGTVIAMAGSGSGRTMVVRRIFQGVGVEMSIMLHSTVLSTVEIVRRGKVRRCAEDAGAGAAAGAGGRGRGRGRQHSSSTHFPQ